MFIILFCLSIVSKITELAGYTHRVSQMFDVFRDMKLGHYERGIVNSKPVKHKQKIEGSLDTLRGAVGFTKFVSNEDVM